MINNITIGGRLTADAELRHCNQGSIICTFTLANNRKYKEIENSTYIEVSLFGAFAEVMQPHLKKGIAIDVIGELMQDVWDHEGKTYYKHKIKAKEIDFRTPKKEKQAIQNIEEGENYEGF
ncbi:single-stranded DNA-binding protein [Campylobacter coli]|uniref:single-stranded DNA-binding protein n=1 Tax=Campylobacter hominis TaxID=76517 RepID=UPI00181504F8|nr:single-stranded DNA-binding protein [Campylobacter hominis]EAJ2736261.1 single-stranded DNA-binding protein [Campylobacter coli]EME3242583.1 single-stranded DNA-binding protein [Campylobacter coli]MCE7088803.1 single-stranded DNA-binding protein [Campylobacter coli]MDD7423362.1 single-stranded DNA-binding protein [Campylobacter hominis]